MSADIRKLRAVAQVVYILHASSIILGYLSGGSVLGAFLFGWPSIAAVIINYVFASDARGTYVASHFSWQIRTFWYGFAWTAGVAAVGMIFSVIILGVALWWLGFIALSLWVTYRIVYGWYSLQQGREVH